LSNTDTSDAAIIENGVDPLWIGARPDTANGHTALKMVGSFDRFRFWDRVLSEEEINDVIANDPLMATLVDKKSKIVTDFALAQNYPNPFNPTTTIHFSIDKNQHTRLVIYDILGREIKRLVDNVRQSGRYTVQWDGTNNQGQPVASGVYFYRLSTPERTKIHKMMLLK
jgi:hypothetical protein